MTTWTRWICATAFVAGCGDNGNMTGGGHDDDGDDDGSPPRVFVYVETNGATDNAVLAFERGSDGGLTAIGSYATGGSGITAGADQRLGPLDSDQQIVSSADGSRLFAVNAGDHTIAGFSIADDGSLTALAGSPFDAGGANPSSIALVDDAMYAVDKAADGTTTPGYASFSMVDNKPTLVSASAVGQLGGSPTIAYVSNDKHFIFGTEFLDGARAADAPVGQIDVLARGSDGTLSHAPGSPYALPADDTGMVPAPPQVALDLVEHPQQPILYVAYPTRSQIGVYSVAASGALTFVRTVPNSGKAVCWFTIDGDANHMFTVNSGSATVSTYDLANPMQPVETGSLTLSDTVSGPPFTDAMGMTQTMTSLPFELALDPDASHLYVISQRVTTNSTDLAGNVLHVLDVAGDGSLTETRDPIDLVAAGAPATSRPQGIRVVSR